jgi:hypothetical protein
LKIRQLSIFFIASSIIYSVLIASYHHHDGCVIRTDCPLCKFALDFSSSGREAAQPIITPDFVLTSFVQESVICIFGICPASLTTRAPPLSSPAQL